MIRALAIASLLFFGSASAQTKFYPFDGTTVNTSNLPSKATSALPACSASLTGQVYLVTDALLPVVGSILGGGGAIQVLIHCNGTNWVIG
jgi:hypothetical protein